MAMGLCVKGLYVYKTGLDWTWERRGGRGLVVCCMSRGPGKEWSLEYVSILFFILLSADKQGYVTTIVSDHRREIDI